MRLQVKADWLVKTFYAACRRNYLTSPIYRYLKYVSFMDDIVYKTIVVPFCILAGMYGCGILIEGLLILPSVFPTVFAAAGGVPALVVYFYKLLLN